MPSTRPVTRPVTREATAGWILRCQPTIWNIDRVREHPGPVPFALPRTYRRHLLETGDPVLLWIGGGGSGSGLAATGSVTAPATDRLEPSLWRDEQRGNSVQAYVDIALRFLPAPVPTRELRAIPGLRELELFRVPRAMNPSAVTRGELRTLRQAIGAVLRQ